MFIHFVAYLWAFCWNPVYPTRLYLTGARRAVVQRDDDTLTSEELKAHASEVAASMLSELNLGSP